MYILLKISNSNDWICADARTQSIEFEIFSKKNTLLNYSHLETFNIVCTWNPMNRQIFMTFHRKRAKSIFSDLYKLRKRWIFLNINCWERYFLLKFSNLIDWIRLSARIQSIEFEIFIKKYTSQQLSFRKNQYRFYSTFSYGTSHFVFIYKMYVKENFSSN